MEQLPPPSTYYCPPNFTVLVVEDDGPAFLKMNRALKPILGNLVESLIHRKTCDDGWALCQERSFDFYIIDGNTPGEIQGIELCKKILEKYKDAIVILYTAMEEVPKDLCMRVIKKDPVELGQALKDHLSPVPDPYSRRKNSSDAGND